MTITLYYNIMKIKMKSRRVYSVRYTIQGVLKRIWVTTYCEAQAVRKAEKRLKGTGSQVLYAVEMWGAQ